MDRKIIHYHDVTSLQRRAQPLFNIEAKGFGIDRSFQHPGCAHTIETERGQQRDIRAIVLRYGFYHSLAWRRTPMAARQCQIDFRLIVIGTTSVPLSKAAMILSRRSWEYGFTTGTYSSQPVNSIVIRYNMRGIPCCYISSLSQVQKPVLHLPSERMVASLSGRSRNAMHGRAVVDR